ncbi:hypothetical protein WA026_004652 [Henosepilachna vigintioctopunctata]|uniref:Fibronectin type-III domain-containing protein n=1 Tax=Henosepilachna vigintioctopunctata TaxID=420089 RepID=A0AAW1V121_9CUCU
MARTSTKTIGFLILLFQIKFSVLGHGVCLPGLKSMGYTVPNGDIMVKYGDPLDIYCILHKEEVEKIGPNAINHLVFQRNSEVLNQEMIQVVNQTTIKLHVDKPSKAKQDNYWCIFRTGALNKSVCMNIVYVGIPPQPVTDFNCISHNLDNLTCRWTEPENFVQTDYNLSFTMKGSINRYNCPEIKWVSKETSERSCMWGLDTDPIYRQSVAEFNFYLKANNTFGSMEKSVMFEHFKHVRPNPPENLRIINKTWNSLYLSWTIPTTMQSFSKGLDCRILYQSAYGEKKWHSRPPTRLKKEETEVHFNLSNLEFAHAYYDIRVSLRSAVADKYDESMWSENASITVLTASKKPDAPPKTNLGGFEVLTYGNNSDWNIRIYWSHIPEEKRNGQNFSYVVTFEDGIEHTTKNAYMLIEQLSLNKSYIFLVRARNEMGFSDEYSFIKIPKHEDRAREPTKLTKQVMKEGTYGLSWQPPQLEVGIINYTIFWCNDEKDRPPCAGTLDWEVVPASLTSFNKTFANNKTYQFAISANTNRGSSGMSWVHCTDSYDKYSVGKVSEFWSLDVGSDFVVVSWIFGCSDKSVTAFIIYYCPISGAPGQNITCKEPENNVTVFSNQTIAKIEKLSPYTTYSLHVAAVIKHTTYSQRSNRLMSTTLEAEPSTAPTDLRLDEVTNSTIKISWNKPVVTNGMLKFYKITYNEFTKQIDDAQTYTLTNLTSYKNYTIRIQACTVRCSVFSEILNVQTKIGYPSVIRKPSINQNATYATISWDRPLKTNGRNERYELRIKYKQGYENITTIKNTTDLMWGIYSCGKDNMYTSFYVSVRAVNLDENKTYYGNWSDEVESYCRSASNYIIYILVPVVILFLLAMTYLSKKIYSHFQEMRDVGVKLPQGLQGEVIETDINLTNWQKPRIEEDHHSADDEEQLLMKKNEGSPNLNGDSSGCSSAHDSVTCSVDTTSNLSSSTSDSGTEQPRTPSSEDLTALAVTNSLRQRNIRPVNKPYVALPLDSCNTGVKLTLKNYCVLGVDPNINSDITSSYTSLPVLSNDRPGYDSTEVPQSPPYVLTGELVKTANPGYVPFKVNIPRDTAVTKNPAYVVAGSKDILSPVPLPVEVKQQSTSIGEVPPLKKESKGYVPHRQFESKALKDD